MAIENNCEPLQPVLESVAGAGSAASLFAQARRQREVPVVEPRLVQTESGWEVVR